MSLNWYNHVDSYILKDKSVCYKISTKSIAWNEQNFNQENWLQVEKVAKTSIISFR